MSAGEPSAELVSDVEMAFLGHWPDDLAVLFRAPFENGVYVTYAHRDGGAYLPPNDESGT